MKAGKEMLDVYFFVRSNKYEGILEIDNPDRLGDHKTAVITVKEPLDISGKVSLVNDTDTTTRSWEVSVPNHREGMKHEVVVLSCTKIIKKTQGNK